MNEFVLTCCSTADLPKERFEQLKVSYVCFNYTIDGVTYPDDLGQSIPFDEFYRLHGGRRNDVHFAGEHGSVFAIF